MKYHSSVLCDADELPHTAALHRTLLPSLLQRPISLNGGMAMPGWYDIASLEAIDAGEDEEGLLESKRYCSPSIYSCRRRIHQRSQSINQATASKCTAATAACSPSSMHLDYPLTCFASFCVALKVH